jgi:acetylornithine/succinyldiaminopimelate/putrescine aminotransferase
MLEAVQGEGGVRIPPEGYLARAREICDRAGALLIFDEVQTGVGRTGAFLASEGAGVTPDIATLAKGLAAGLPLGAMLAREEVASALVPGTHASTFGGNPLCCALAQVVVDTVRPPEFQAEVRRKGALVLERLDQMRARFDFCVEARGQGLLCGLEVDRELPGLVDRGRAQGVLLNVIGQRVIRVAPPLVITDDELEEGLAALGRALEESAP